jgi:hypothetical protein
MAHHQSILQQLNEQRADVQSELDLLVYPVLTLPLEITAEIFKCCFNEGLILSRKPAPLLLTQICHNWRTLALSTPALWDTFPEIELDDPQQLKALATTWFSRAGTRPLSLTVIYPPHAESAPLEFIIRQHASQFQSLNIMADSDVLELHPTVSPPPGPHPCFPRPERV